MVPGMALERQNVAGRLSIQKTMPPHWPVEFGLQTHESYVLSGYMQVTKENVYQFQLSVSGDAQLFVNGELIHAKTDDSQPLDYVPVTLKPGWHEVTLRGTLGSKVHLHLAFGGPGAYSVGQRQFHHVP